MSKQCQIPTTSHSPVSNPPMAMKATEMQILSTDKAVFNLAKPMLASVLYTIDSWPSCSQNENALCDSAWSKALDAQSCQLRAVGAMQLYDDITTISGGASKVMDSLTRGIVRSQNMSILRCDQVNSYAKKSAVCGVAWRPPHDSTLLACTIYRLQLCLSSRSRFRPYYTTTRGWVFGTIQLMS